MSSACSDTISNKQESKWLDSSIQVRDEQTGVVGVVATIWTINPDSSYRVEHLNANVLSLDREGRLTEGQMNSLAETLSTARVGDLPPKLGLAPQANQRRIVIESGGGRCELALFGGASLEEARASAGEEGSPAVRVIEIALSVSSLVGDEIQ